MTRLMKSFSDGGAKPTRPANQASPLATGLVGSAIVTSGVNESSPSNTTMSPRLMSRRWYTTLLTMTRSPTCSVFSIDPEGM